MIRFQKNAVTVFVGLVLMIGVLGCPKKQAETASQTVSPDQSQVQPAIPPSVETIPPTEQHPVTEEAVKPVDSGKTVLKSEGLKDIYFEYDKSAIKPDMKNMLDQDVAWLKANSQAKVQLEGHCDERGTNEYNLALGEKRAHSIKQFLISLGIKAERISTISYGEDRPFCKEQAESCYQQNRRVHFVVK